MIKSIKQECLRIIPDIITCDRLPDDSYTNMKYPKLIPLMRFHVDRYRLRGFGYLMIMHTTTKMGMELLTMSFMPSDCVNLPYLLIDSMRMRKKRCVFVEYYGCGSTNLNDSGMKTVYKSYNHLPDYAEKENWYIAEREPYSLIKTGEADTLKDMAVSSVSAYLSSVDTCVVDENYKTQLLEFRERMITEGNPSSATLKMLLKEEGARAFMEQVIMPV